MKVLLEISGLKLHYETDGPVDVGQAVTDVIAQRLRGLMPVLQGQVEHQCNGADGASLQLTSKPDDLDAPVDGAPEITRRELIEDEAAQAPAPAKVRRPKAVLAGRQILCLEKPGQILTFDQAVELLGGGDKAKAALIKALYPSSWSKGGTAAGFHFANASAGRCPTWPAPTAKDDALLIRLRKEKEDQAVGVLCDQCGFEPEEPDRRRTCPKCNAKRWVSKARGPLDVPGGLDESED